jgi:hypothetical protein
VQILYTNLQRLPGKKPGSRRCSFSGQNALKLTYAHVYFKRVSSGSLALAIKGDNKGGEGRETEGREGGRGGNIPQNF